MKVSCIIPTFRQMEYLFDTIKSVLEQEYKKIELIVSDDGSENFDQNSVENFIVENRRHNLVSYEIVRHTVNIGTVRNMNDALKHCTGEIIIPIASDDIFYDCRVISRIVERFEDTKCEVMSCSRYLCSSDMQKKIRLMPHPGYYNRLKKLATAEKQYKSMAMGKTFEFASGAALYYRNSYIKKCGYYDERYILWEDGPFLAKTTRNGVWVCMAYDIVTVLYRDGGISSAIKSKAPGRIYKDYCNIILLEYLAYTYRFSKREQRILHGKQALQVKNNIMTIVFSLKYPEAAVNYFVIKVEKGLDRLLYKLGKGRTG